MPGSPLPSIPPPPSPCTKVCVLDGAGYCAGCMRTGEEIARWSSMGPQAQWRLIEALAQRRLERAPPGTG